MGAKKLAWGKIRCSKMGILMEKCFCDNKIKSKRDGGVLESFKNIEQVKRNGFLKWRYLWRIFQGTKWVAKKLPVVPMKILRKIKDHMKIEPVEIMMKYMVKYFLVLFCDLFALNIPKYKLQC